MVSPKIYFWPNTRKASVASHRIRCANVVSGLKSRGMKAAYYHGRIEEKLGFIPFRRPSEVLILSKRTKLSSLQWAVNLKRQFGTKLILDICDNIFFNKQKNNANSSYVETVAALNEFDVIVTPSRYLARSIAQHLRHDMRIEVIFDAVEQLAQPRWPSSILYRSAVKDLRKLGQEISASKTEIGRRLVWFGNHGTNSARNGMYDLEHFAPFLNEHDKENPISLTVISNNKHKYEQIFSKQKFKSYYLEWNLGTIDRALQMHDIALIPVRKNEYNFSKSANRVTTSLMNGLAVCASSIDSYEPFKSCITLDDWDHGLGKLMTSHDLREESVKIGNKLIESDYTIAAISLQWQQLLESL